MSEANHNPLIAPLLVLLQQAAGSYKVHELMAALRQQGRSPAGRRRAVAAVSGQLPDHERPLPVAG